MPLHGQPFIGQHFDRFEVAQSIERIGTSCGGTNASTQNILVGFIVAGHQGSGGEGVGCTCAYVMQVVVNDRQVINSCGLGSGGLNTVHNRRLDELSLPLARFDVRHG